MKPMTIAEKILSRKAGRPLYAGDFATVKADSLMIHDSNAFTTIEAFKTFAQEKILPGTDVVMVMDHFSPSSTEAAANMHIKMRQFKAQQELTLYEVGDGVGHQLMCEQGHVFPGEIAVGTDSHSCTYGALNALGTGIGSTEAAGIMAYGKIWFRVPETIHIKWNGSLPAGVTAKDVVLRTVEKIGLRHALYRTLEFSGELIAQLSIDERLTISNMGIEVGAKAALMPPDNILDTWIAHRPRIRSCQPAAADKGAEYFQEYELNADELEPLIAYPPMVNQVVPVRQFNGKKIDQVVLGSCTNGRASDFREAAKLLAGQKVAPGVRLVLLPASKAVLEDLLADGTMESLVRAGGMIITPGCGPCGGYHGGLVGNKEVVLATTNRNFTGRMGSQDSELYLASPLTAAAAALTGIITDPREVCRV
ncbi:MAG: aconitase/3-isopropylmalate dehydratase large subunit family protein [Peptococcaceae bacterium]